VGIEQGFPKDAFRNEERCHKEEGGGPRNPEKGSSTRLKKGHKKPKQERDGKKQNEKQRKIDQKTGMYGGGTRIKLKKKNTGKRGNDHRENRKIRKNEKNREKHQTKKHQKDTRKE